MSDPHAALDWAPQALSSKEATVEKILIRDRSLPAWAATLSAMFTFGTALCYGALILFSLFLHQLVAIDGIEIYAPILGLSALVPILGILLFEVGHARALIGHPDLRRRSGPIGGVIAAVLAAGGLFMLHPILPLPPILAVFFSWVVAGPLARALPKEHAWNRLPEEAASVLSGRDRRGLTLLWQAKRRAPMVDAILQGIVTSSFIAAFTLASWLTLREVLTAAAIAPTALISTAIAIAFVRYWRSQSCVDPEHANQARAITALPAHADSSDAADMGLWVDRLSITAPNGTRLLHDISFHLPAGSITALVGDSFAGKSLLLNAITAPHDLPDLEVEGLVKLNGLSPWDRSANAREASVVFLPAEPIFIPDSGHANLLHPKGDMERRAEHLLKSMLHNADTARRILNCSNANTLSHTEKKVLSFARAACLRPALYLLDRPEDGCNEVLRTTLLNRLREETRRGATILLATEDRAMLDACDQMISLQSGRLVDMAPTEEMQARATAGWQRFVAVRELESEDALDSWINAQFRRDGDGANRRAVCMVANEMLALACRFETVGIGESVCFEMKLFVGRCVLRMKQSQPLSSGALERASALAASDAALTDAPLARILRDSISVENTRPDNQHWLEVAISIYDPRKSPAPSSVQAPATKAKTNAKKSG